jgi:hypothetical protein
MSCSKTFLWINAACENFWYNVCGEFAIKCHRHHYLLFHY